MEKDNCAWQCSGSWLCRVGVGVVLTMVLTAAQGQYANVMVKMQSGEIVQLIKLPWVIYSSNLLSSQYEDRAVTADWVVYSPPKFCPIGNQFRVQWQGAIESHMSATQDSCNSKQNSKLNGLPEDLKKLCNCKLVLKTVSRSINREGLAMWQSEDDDLLNSEELKIRKTLVYKSESIPVIFSLGESNSSIYDFKGNKLCALEFGTNVKKSGKEFIEKIWKAIDKPVSVTCMKSKLGMLDVSKLTYEKSGSLGLYGEMIIKFSNGEEYVIE